MILPLDEFRRLVGYNPYHFWNQESNKVPVTSTCNTRLMEYAWQSADAVSRVQIRDAIAQAKARLFEYLNYRIGSRYVEKEFRYPRPADVRMQYVRPADAQGRWLSVNVKEGYIREMGAEALTVIDEPTVSYSDANGDGLTDTFTVTVTTTVTDVDQIAVYFNSTDRGGENVGDAWRIEPVKVSISGGTATITGPSWILVRPIIFERVTQNAIDPDNTGNPPNLFAQTLEVYWRRTDSSGQAIATAAAVFVWESDPPLWAWPCNTTACCRQLNYDPNETDPAALAYAVARANIRDARTGEIYAGEAVLNSSGQWDRVNWSGCKQPDRIILRYLAGADEREISNRIYSGGNWRQILARLAMAELPGCFCADSRSNQVLSHWQFDLARVAGANDEQYGTTGEILNNPLGTRRGAVYAWRQIRSLRLTRGILV